MIVPAYIRPKRRMGRQERYAERAGLQGEREAEIRHVDDRQLFTWRARVVLLARTAEVVSRAHHHVADPGRDDALYAAGADHLVKENVGDGPDEREPAPLLPHELVPRSK